MQKKSLILLFFTFTFLVGFFYFLFVSKRNNSKDLDIEKISTTTEEVLVSKRDVPKGFLEYRNEMYSFSLIYPEDLSVVERFQFGGAVTITYENIKGEKGFQIFIVPYNEPQVSLERFRIDMPSLIQKDLVSIDVDGAVGASFYGFDENLGETKEVWFINRGFLYEVTTLKPLESWLNEIIKTWEFIN